MVFPKTPGRFGIGKNGPRPIRIAFKTEVSDSDEARKEIVELVKIARKKSDSSME